MGTNDVIGVTGEREKDDKNAHTTHAHSTHDNTTHPQETKIDHDVATATRAHVRSFIGVAVGDRNTVATCTGIITQE